ncbi:MAG: hypothetical protein D6813_07835 [Calditrichaeota bacterium]|nr:MAG: hypothetical protein D6813_07835 [Calditrichota bacterium]
MFSIKKFKIFIIIITLFLSSGSLQAQESDRSQMLNRASQYILGDKDQILIKVNVWGFVQSPGQYLIPRHTDLISLISFAGGPREGANLTQVKIIREAEAKNNAHDGNGHDGDEQNSRAPIYTINVKEYLETGRTDLIPTLEAGDTILIPQSFGNKFKNFLGVTSVVGLLAATATLVLVFERL